MTMAPWNVSDSVHVLVVGTSGVGGVVAAALAEQGHPVTLWTRDPVTSDAVETRGLRTQGEQCAGTVALRATLSSPTKEGPFDVALIATAPRHAVQAAKAAAPRLAEHGVMVCLSGGMSDAAVAQAVGPAPVLGAAALWGASRLEAGEVDRTSSGAIALGVPEALEHEGWRRDGEVEGTIERAPEPVGGNGHGAQLAQGPEGDDAPAHGGAVADEDEGDDAPAAGDGPEREAARAAVTAAAATTEAEHGGRDRAQAALSAVAELLEAVSPVAVTDQLLGVRWAQHAIDCVVGGLGAISGERVGELARKPWARQLALELLAEAAAVADALGVELEPLPGALSLNELASSNEDRAEAPGAPTSRRKHALLRAVASRHRRVRSHLLDALERNRTDEPEWYGGWLVARGRAHEVAMPVHDALQQALEKLAARAMRPSERALLDLYETTRRAMPPSPTAAAEAPPEAGTGEDVARESPEAGVEDAGGTGGIEEKEGDEGVIAGAGGDAAGDAQGDQASAAERAPDTKGPPSTDSP